MYWDTSVTFIVFATFEISLGKLLIEFSVVLTNVWFDWGKCFTAPFDADTKVWTDWGKCFTASIDDDTNVWIEPDALPPSPTLIVNVPSCLSNPFVVADTNVWAAVYGEEPILISNVFVVTLEISNHLPDG